MEIGSEFSRQRAAGQASPPTGTAHQSPPRVAHSWSKREAARERAHTIGHTGETPSDADRAPRRRLLRCARDPWGHVYPTVLGSHTQTQQARQIQTPQSTTPAPRRWGVGESSRRWVVGESRRRIGESIRGNVGGGVGGEIALVGEHRRRIFVVVVVVVVVVVLILAVADVELVVVVVVAAAAAVVVDAAVAVIRGRIDGAAQVLVQVDL